MREGKGRIVLLGILWMGFGAAISHAQNSSHAGGWCLPDDRLGIRTAPLLLLSPLTFRSIYDSNGHRSWELKTRSMSANTSSPDPARQDGAAVVAERRAIDEAQLDWLSNNLTGNQLERLRQIELQWEGVPAMLAAPWSAVISSSLRNSSKRWHESSPSGTGFEHKAARHRKLSRLFTEKPSVLSNSQKELWANLLGTPFRFAATTVPPGKRDVSAQRAG